MSNTNDQSLKQLTDRLADTLSSKEGATALSLLQLLGAQPQTAGENQTTPQDNGIHVGIWSSEAGDNTVLVRNPKLKHKWNHWADVEQIQLKSDNKRVVLVGESVARGHFYDPYYTPSQVVQSILAEQLPTENPEVIDLACCGMAAPQLAQTIKQAMVLSPDALVIFAGNNWFHAQFNTMRAHQRFELAEKLRQSGSLKQAEAYFKEDIAKTVGQMLTQAAQLPCPVILVLPEYNLVDFGPSTHGQRTPWLPNNATAQWLQARQKARQALKIEDFDEVEAQARKMVELDQGLAAAGASMLADCLTRKGEHESARRYYEQARDSELSTPFYMSPRIYSTTAEVFKTQAKALGLTLVDLPAVFNRLNEGKLPGRELFLDYSHLTATGIKVAGAAIASQLLSHFGGSAQDWQTLSKDLTLPDNDVMANAHLMATMHNSSFDQSQDICRYHALEAVKLNPQLIDTMTDILDCRTRRTNSRVCASFKRLCENNKARSIYLVGDTPLDNILELKLLDAFYTAFRAVGATAQISQIEALVNQEYCINRHGKLNLLDTQTTRNFDFPNPKRAFTRATDSQSLFHLVCETAAPLKLNITYRVAEPLCDQNYTPVAIVVNGQLLDNLQPINHWSDMQLSIPQGMLKPGINEIHIEWPQNLDMDGNKMDAVIAQLEQGSTCTEVFPCFGEIQRLTVEIDQ